MKQEMEKQRVVKFNKELLRFIADSPTAYQAVEQVSKKLCAAGFVQQEENVLWESGAGVLHGFVVRNGSSLIAYTIPAERPLRGFHMVCAHTVRRRLKLKKILCRQTAMAIKIKCRKIRRHDCRHMAGSSAVGGGQGRL